MLSTDLKHELSDFAKESDMKSLERNNHISNRFKVSNQLNVTNKSVKNYTDRLTAHRLGILTPSVKTQQAQILFGYEKSDHGATKDVYKRYSITQRFTN